MGGEGGGEGLVTHPLLPAPPFQMDIALLGADAERFLHWAPPWAPGSPSAEPRAQALQDWFGRLEGSLLGRPGGGGALWLDLCVAFVAGKRCSTPCIRLVQTLGRAPAPAG